MSTPRPWDIGDVSGHWSGPKDDPALIVRAVNSHDELVEMLIDAMKYYENLGITQPWFGRAKAVLDKLRVGT